MISKSFKNIYVKQILTYIVTKQFFSNILNINKIYNLIYLYCELN